MNIRFLSAALGLLLVVPGLTIAAEEAHQTVTFSPSGFEAQREAIIKGLRGNTYRELDDSNRQLVLQALDRIERNLGGVERIADMDKRVQTEVFNDQELINNLLTVAAADSRMICKREKVVGSHRSSNVCLSVAERRELVEAAQEQTRRLQRSGNVPPPYEPGG